ncbi:MAG: uroporphyrinogen decarboxylase family protein [Verrucomicrobiae bacterium]|nr:uroporphyrinogen decarboxylase family protein [Verrucomicrobiae bacterium]
MKKLKHPDNMEKAELWRRYAARQPGRTPVILGTNPRVVLFNREWNPEGYTFEQMFSDPQVHVEVVLRHQLYCRTVLNRFTDSPTGLPEEWHIGMHLQNIVEAAWLGAGIDFPSNQVPSTSPILDDARKEDIFSQDIDHPLDSPFYRKYKALWEEMRRICSTLKYAGRPVKLSPPVFVGTDGPVTVACNLRGTNFLTDLVEDPEYADRLLIFLTDAAIKRRQACFDAWAIPEKDRGNWMADDSIALISPGMYRERVLPLHKRFYETGPRDAVRGMHLCGDATRHFKTIARELGVTSFDTGFPVDHGALRGELGPDVEILGGPEVALLERGTPDEVYARTRQILLSGVRDGGRFQLREGNNLPPGCPLENLDAMYEACLELR